MLALPYTVSGERISHLRGWFCTGMAECLQDPLSLCQAGLLQETCSKIGHLFLPMKLLIGPASSLGGRLTVLASP